MLDICGPGNVLPGTVGQQKGRIRKYYHMLLLYHISTAIVNPFRHLSPQTTPYQPLYGIVGPF